MKKITQKLLIVLLTLSLSLSARIINDFYIVETWFYFEPGENYTLQSSYFSVTNEVSYFPYVSDLIRAKEIPKTRLNVKREKVIISWFDALEDTSQYGSQNSLGMKLTWDRRGSHYVDIIPRGAIEDVKEVATKSILEISMWVWSGNYEHELTTVFQRNSGYQYVIPMAKLNFLGWQKVVAKIPEEIKTDSRDAYFSDEEFYFDRFRIYTHPTEKVANIYVFFDNFEVLRKLDYKSYNGEDIVPHIKTKLGIGNQSFLQGGGANKVQEIPIEPPLSQLRGEVPGNNAEDNTAPENNNQEAGN